MKKKNAIAVLGGGTVKNPDGTWRTTNYKEKDQFGVIGDRVRVLAAYYLYRDNPKQIIIALGGKGQRKHIKGVVPSSFVIKKELCDLGVPARDIIAESKSGSTFESLRTLKEIILSRGLQKVAIISNRYHIPRIKAMLESSEVLKKITSPCQISLQDAEQVVVAHDPAIVGEIEKAYKSKAMQERIALEKKGIKDIYEGKYTFNNPI